MEAAATGTTGTASLTASSGKDNYYYLLLKQYLIRWKRQYSYRHKAHYNTYMQKDSQ